MKKIMALVLALMLVLGSVSFAAADEIKNFKDYQTQANEMETFCYHYSQAAVWSPASCHRARILSM